jgi:L-ascorbate metabolism protein UlaG (beta-lactamase superfamily)
MQRSDHFDGSQFFNPGGANGQPFRKLPRLMLTPHARWPHHVPVTPQEPPIVQGGDIAVTLIGHVTFLLQSASGNLLTDPVYSERASPVSFAGPRRITTPGVTFDDLPRIDTVLISHNHYDHCDLPTVRRLQARFNPLFVTPLRNAALLRKAGAERIVELDWWEAHATGGVEVTLTPAQHFSARSPFDRNRALWGGFSLHVQGRHIFFSGDTGYGTHFQEIRARLGRVDLALLPIGAYEPRWFMKDIHMNPAESVTALCDLEAAHGIAMHYGTFRLTPEPIDEPPRALLAALRGQGVAPERFTTLAPGESRILNS